MEVVLFLKRRHLNPVGEHALSDFIILPPAFRHSAGTDICIAETYLKVTLFMFTRSMEHTRKILTLTPARRTHVSRGVMPYQLPPLF